MVPVEWPIAATAVDGGLLPARAAGSGRLPIVRTDFFLNPNARLTEQERALMTAMLADLVAMLADDFSALLADAEPANDDGEQLFDRLWSTGLLDIPDLLRLLLRRAEEERVGAGILAGRQTGKARLLQSLVSDPDAEVSAAAMALILARGRRRDRFDGPRLMFDDLSAESAVTLVNAIAAGLRADLAVRFGGDEADERLSGAVRALLTRHDEGNRLEAKLFDLVHALDRAGRIDEAFFNAVLDQGEVQVLTEVLARRAGVSFDCAWDLLSGGGQSLALLLSMSGTSRDLAGEVIASMAEIVGSTAEAEMAAFDRTTDDEVESARKWLRLDPAYRSAASAIGGGHGQRPL